MAQILNRPIEQIAKYKLTAALFDVIHINRLIEKGREMYFRILYI